jgi:GT2 family glycosyltransferase
MEILVSVVIPTYKRPSLLFRCLSALGRQNFPAEALEIIVVTDGPDPDTVRLCAELASTARTRFCSLGKKKGPAAARNAGWRQARGELILFTDDDCLPAKDWVRSYYLAYEQYKQANPLGWFFGQCAAFRGPVVVPRPDRPTDHEKNTAGLETAAFVTANCACTIEALERTGGFDESFTMAWREDSDLEFKLLELSIPILTVPAARVIHPVRLAPWGISLREQKKSLFNALLYKKHPALFRAHIHRYPFFNYYAIVGFLTLAALAALFGQQRLALTAFVAWLLLTLDFARRRLTGTAHTPGHVLEMLLTSMLIPLLSVFWTLYGSFRYKTFFL